MKYREKIQQELNRRLAEVTWYRDYPINDQDLAKDFFGRVADYVNYIKVNSDLRGFVEKLKTDRKNIAIDKDLEKEGNDILAKMKKDFQTVNEVVKRNNTEIKPFAPVNGALSDSQAISLTYEQLQGFLGNETQYVAEIPSHIGEMWSLLGRLEGYVSDNDKAVLKDISESYYPISPRFREKLRLQSHWISFLRFDDYEHLEDAWSYYFDPINPQEFSLLRIELGEVLGEGITFPSLSSANVNKLEQRKKEYLLHINRFHNYLIDRLEEKVWSEEALLWFWDNYGKVLVGMWLSLFLLYILKMLGITVPIDVINNLLNR